MASTIYFEVFVNVRILFSNVLRYDFVGHVAGAAAEISASPEMPAPKLFLQVWKLSQQVMRRPAFQPLHQAADSYLRRQRDQQMHVILRYMPCHDRDIMLSADIPDQIPNPRRYLPV